MTNLTNAKSEIYLEIITISFYFSSITDKYSLNINIKSNESVWILTTLTSSNAYIYAIVYSSEYDGSKGTIILSIFALVIINSVTEIDWICWCESVSMIF